jgi:hypothetical protein
MTASREYLPKLALRELLMVVALIALGCAALKYANDMWFAVIAAIVFLTFFRALIVAAVDRGPAQAFAIGMALVMAGYALLLLSSRTTNQGMIDNQEFTRGGVLPTTQLLEHLNRSISDFRWIDVSGNADRHFQAPVMLDNVDLTAEALRKRLRNGQNLPGVSFKGMVLQKTPDEEPFYRTGHLLWSLMLGFVGGMFARSMYQRRIARPPQQAVW